MASSRAAVLTVSPSTLNSVRPGGPKLPATTVPVWTPTRIAKRRSAGRARLDCSTRSSMRKAQRSARVAPSAMGMGAPKTATTESPTNLSSVPCCSKTAWDIVP
jgi:hypothetical protein